MLTAFGLMYVGSYLKEQIIPKLLKEWGCTKLATVVSMGIAGLGAGILISANLIPNKPIIKKENNNE